VTTHVAVPVQADVIRTIICMTAGGAATSARSSSAAIG